MFLRLSSKRRSSPRELVRLEEMKIIYSSRDEKIQLLRKFAANRIKTCEKTIPKKKIKISIQIPKLENYMDEENVATVESPLRNIGSATGKRRRVVAKSNLDRVYGFARRTMTPYQKLSYGIFNQ